jgi:hypothetical protein
MKIPGTPLETLARTGAPEEVGRWLRRGDDQNRLQQSPMVIFGTKCLKNAVDQTNQGVCSTRHSPVHDILVNEGIQLKGRPLECMLRPTYPCEATVHPLLAFVYTRQ